MRIRAFFRQVFAFPVRWLISVKSIPANIETELGIEKSKPILYLVQTASFTDQVALRLSTKSLGLPDPQTDVNFLGESHKRTYFLNRPQTLFTRKVKKTSIEDTFTELFHIHRENPDLDLQVIPVFISWGRAAGNEL